MVLRLMQIVASISSSSLFKFLTSIPLYEFTTTRLSVVNTGAGWALDGASVKQNVAILIHSNTRSPYVFANDYTQS